MAGSNFCLLSWNFLIIYILTYSNTSLTDNWLRNLINLNYLNGSSSDVYYILNMCPNLGKNLLNDFSELVPVSFQTSIVIVEVLSWLKIVLKKLWRVMEFTIENGRIFYRPKHSVVWNKRRDWKCSIKTFLTWRVSLFTVLWKYLWFIVENIDRESELLSCR